MEVTSLQKFVHTSPRKLRLVADMVKKQHPEKAMLTLRFTNKAAAKELGDAINTALSNAGQGGLDMNSIVFKSIEINEGPRMKRFRAGARGRVKPYKRRMSHIKIVISDEFIVDSKIKNQKLKVVNQNAKIENTKEAVEEVKVEATTPITNEEPKAEKTAKRTVKKAKKGTK